MSLLCFRVSLLALILPVIVFARRYAAKQRLETSGFRATVVEGIRLLGLNPAVGLALCDPNLLATEGNSTNPTQDPRSSLKTVSRGESFTFPCSYGAFDGVTFCSSAFRLL